MFLYLALAHPKVGSVLPHVDTNSQGVIGDTVVSYSNVHGFSALVVGETEYEITDGSTYRIKRGSIHSVIGDGARDVLAIDEVTRLEVGTGSEGPLPAPFLMPQPFFPEKCCDTLELFIPQNVNFSIPNDLPRTFTFLDAKEMLKKNCIDKACPDALLDPPGYLLLANPDSFDFFDGPELFFLHRDNISLSFLNKVNLFYDNFDLFLDQNVEGPKLLSSIQKESIILETPSYQTDRTLWAVLQEIDYDIRIYDYDCGSTDIIFHDYSDSDMKRYSIPGASLTCAVSKSSKLAGWEIALISLGGLTFLLITAFAIKKNFKNNAEMNEYFL